MSSLNQASPCSSASVANGAALLTGSNRSTPQFWPVAIIIIIVESEISCMSSSISPSESAFVGSVPYDSSSKLNNLSLSESKTWSQECSPSVFAKSFHSGTPFSPLKWSSKLCFIASVSSGQSQFAESGSNRVKLPAGWKTSLL